MQRINIPWAEWEIVRELGHGGNGTVYEIIRTDKFGVEERATMKVLRFPHDETGFISDYGSQIENVKGLVADCIDGELSKTKGLSNGDEVVYQWKCDTEKAAADYKAELSFNDITDIVSGLEELPDTTGMIFPESADTRLTNADVEGMDMDELRSALEEIYARHGYIFANSQIQQEFATYSWYKPTIDADDWDGDVELNRIEKYNVEFLKIAIKELKEKAE